MNTSHVKLPKLSVLNQTELSFNDEKLRILPTEPRNYTQETDQNSLTLITTQRMNTEPTDIYVQKKQSMEDTEDVVFGTTVTEIRPKKLNKQSRERKKLVSSTTTANFRELKTKLIPNYSVNDFYLKNLTYSRQESRKGKTNLVNNNNTQLNSSRNSNGMQSSLLDSIAHKSQPLNETKRSLIMSKRQSSPLRQALNDLTQTEYWNKGVGLKFYESLGPSLKQFFSDKKEFTELFSDIDVASFCMDEIISRVKCYRAELGAVIEKANFSYKKLFEKFSEQAMKMVVDKKTIYDKKMIDHMSMMEQINKEKNALEEKAKHYKSLIDIRDSEVKIFQFNLNSLDSEVKMLHELLRKDYILESKIDPVSEQIKRQIEGKKLSEPSEALNQGLITLQDNIKDLETAQESKKQLLSDMNNLLKAMLKGGKKDQQTQVNDGELSWGVSNLKSEISTQQGQIQRSSLIQSPQQSSVNVKDQILAQQSTTKDNVLNTLDPIIQLNMESMDQNEEEEQQDPINQSPGKIVGKKVSLEAMQNIAQAISDNWNLPISLILFLQNCSTSKETANVLPWSYFKKQIYEIYNDRILNESEMSYNLVSNYVPLNEYIIIYHLKKYKLRRIAEIKLLEFLVSLRYYIKYWPRALTLANLCGITSLKLGNNMTSITQIESFDEGVQNFFLFCISKVILSYTEFIYEHQDGISYLYREKAEELTYECLIFESENNKKKFMANLQRHYRYFTEEDEGIDIDRLVAWYLESFLDCRNSNRSLIQKNFMRAQNGGDGIISLDDLSDYVEEFINQDSPVQGYAYPDRATLTRAFLYALTSSKNSYGVSIEDILNSLSKFGIDTPIPIIGIPGGFSPSSLSKITSQDELRSSTRKSLMFPRKSKISSSNNRGNSAITSLPFVKDNTKRSTAFGSSEDDTTFKLVSEYKENKNKRNDEQRQSINYRLDSSTALFAQHYGILRELKQYCIQFRNSIKRDQDIEVVKKDFEQILQILEAGCEFLTYPINV